MDDVDGEELCNCERGGDSHFGDCLFKFYQREKDIYEGWSRDKVSYEDNFNELIELSYSRFENIRELEANQVNLFDSLVKVNRECLLNSYKRYKQINFDIKLIEGRLVFLERQYDTLRSYFVV